MENALVHELQKYKLESTGAGSFRICSGFRNVMEPNPASDRTLTALVDFLKRPDSWPDPPGKVEHIQTHASHLFIGTSLVYKIKKAVDYGFLDYSTLEKRRGYCHREVELNRRLSEGVYLGVVPIIRTGEGTYRFGTLREDGPSDDGKSDEGEIVEYAVVMNRLKEGHFLLDYLRAGRLTEDHLEQVARKLARFYRSREPDPEVLEYGLPKNIWFNTEENFRQTELFIGTTISRPVFRAIRHYAARFLEVNGDRFHRRIDRRRIVEGHGDLHLEHIHWSGDTVQIYDCIEFNERFRNIDLAADIAFLAMDLDFHGCPRLERYFIGRMKELLGDDGLAGMLDFYKCYRAWVRGKVKSLHSREEEVPEADREESAETARRYFELALRYAVTGSVPVAVAVMGPIATGKSTLARLLSEALDLPLVSSDRVRKELAGLPLYERTSPDRRKELYSTEMSDKTYEALADRAVQQSEKGTGAVLDATYSDPMRRRRLIGRMEEAGVNWLFVEAHASDAVVRQRLEGRAREEGVISDARAEDFEALTRLYRSPGEIGRQHLVRIDTEEEPERMLEQLLMELATRNAEDPG